MDVNKTSDSRITFTISVEVELGVLLEEGAAAFAVKCREALEAELVPILRIGAPPLEAARVTSEPTVQASPERVQESPSVIYPEDSMDAQIPPSARGRG